MRLTGLRIINLLFLAGFICACAHQPANYEETMGREMNCEAVSYHSTSRQECYVEEHPPYSDAESDSEYRFFSVVLEGLLRGVVEGLLQGVIYSLAK